jgi:hypothetical protein
MIKLTLITTATLVAISTSALADSQVWNVTEEGASGIKSAQGQWTVNIADNKISGSANMQSDKGAVLTYTLDGSKSESVYAVNISNRTDGKTGCVWSGHIPAGVDMKSHGLIGEAHCEDKVGSLLKPVFESRV